MHKFGIVQIARTGRLILKRGASLFSGREYVFQDLQQQNDSTDGSEEQKETGKDSKKRIHGSFALEEHHDVYAGGSIEDEGA